MSKVFATACSLIALTTSSVVYAQDNNVDNSSVVEEIVVTGSQIARAADEVAVPVVSVSRDVIDQSGQASLDEILAEMPQMGIGFGASNTFFNYDDPGAAFANLRSLGTNRSLVLVNGRRRVSGSRSSSAVDLNSIPPGMIERVEIISGGASAIYGADAVSGVINLITRHDQPGFRLSAKAGISEHGDAATQSVDAFGGTTFADGRGQINAGFSYSNREALMFGDRKFSDRQLTSQANPENTGPNDGIPDLLTWDDVRVSYITPDASVYMGGTHYMWTANGLEPVTGQVLTGGALGHTQGGNVPHWYSYISLRSPLEAYAGRADVSFEITPNITIFAEGEYSRTNSDTLNQYYRFDNRSFYFAGNGGPQITFDNPYLPAELADLARENGLGTVAVRKQLLDELGALRNKHKRETYTFVGGFQGRFGNDWNWQLTHQHGKFVDNITNTNLIMGTRFTNAVDVISDPATGAPVCRSEAARAEGCVPVNLFERGPFSQAQRDYFVRDRIQRVQNTQDLTAFSLSGSLFELPHGPLSVAIGAERRKETLRTNDDPLALSGELYFFGVVPSTELDESFEVKEAYAEMTAPVLGDLPFIRKLSLEAAVRVSDYSTIGTTTAWRAGANWQINDDLRLRVVRSASVRAPNLFELYQPLAMSTLRITDPCSSVLIDAKPNRRANCAAMGIDNVVDDQALTTSWSGGNRDLKEEKSNSFTVGATFTPSFLPGLLLKADYYNIEINGAVSAFTAQQYVNNCFDASTIDNPFCSQIRLDENNLVSEVYVGNINVAKLKTSGIDFGMDYTLPLGKLGRLNFYINGTYLLDKEQLVVPDDESTLIIQAGEYTDPDWLLNSRISYMNEGFTFSMSNRYISKSRVDMQSSLEYYDRPYVASRFYTDFTVSQRINGNAKFYIGLNNAFNVKPPEIAQSYIYAGVLGGARYDNIGRYFHTGVNFDF